MSVNCLPDHVTAMMDALAQQPTETGIVSALQSAARLVEFAAFEMARSDHADQVARLILLAAELERTSDRVGQAQ